MRKNIFRSLSAILTVSMLLSGQPVFYAGAADISVPDSYTAVSDNATEDVSIPDSYTEVSDDATEEVSSPAGNACSDNDAEEVSSPAGNADSENSAEDASLLAENEMEETETEKSDTEPAFDNDTPDKSYTDSALLKYFDYYIDDEQSRLYLSYLVSNSVTEVEIPSTVNLNGAQYTVWLCEAAFSEKTKLKKS